MSATVTPAWNQGWYAERGSTAGSWRWQPVLQLDGYSPGLEVWFDSRERCQEFIREEIVGKPLMEEA